jgi:DNA-binding NarL/FixJ family response regulator
MIHYAETTTVQRDARSWSAWAERIHFIEQAPSGDLRARIVLADRSDLMRAGLRVALETDSQVEVVGEARDSRDAVAKARNLHADLLVLESDMLDIDGLSTLRQLQHSSPKTRVLLLGTHNAPDFMYEALEAGAAGYVLKAASLPEVRSAVREALNARRGRPVQESPQAATERLSAREIQVIEQVARGRTNRQIGAELVITPNTVKAHIEHILAKLDVRDRTQAAVRAVELGYVRHANSLSRHHGERLR